MSDIDQKEKGCSPQEMSSMTKETSREPPAAIHTDRETEYDRPHIRTDSLDLRHNTLPMNFSERDHSREPVEVSRTKE